MSASAQLEVLTTGVTLPLPPVPQHILERIAQAVLETAAALAAQYPIVFATESEKEINGLLASCLGRRANEDREFANVVSHVFGDAARVAYDGTVEKHPDLQIVLTLPGRPRLFPLLLESKLLDRPNQTLRKYVGKDGLLRFVDGRYAWEMAEAFMFALVRDGSSIDNDLVSELSHWQSRSPDPTGTIALPVAPRVGSVPRSRHARGFSYQHVAGSPGPITLWHLWVSIAL